MNPFRFLRPRRRLVGWSLCVLFLSASLAVGQSANRLKAIELIKQAAAIFERGDMNTVITVCRQAIALDPTYPRAYTWIGAASQRKGDRQTACSAFNRVIRLAPNTPDSQRAARGLRELGCAPASGSSVGGYGAPLNLRLEGRWNATAGISSLAFSSDGQFLSGGGGDGAWRLWRLPDGRLERLERGNGYEATATAASPSYYAVGSGDGKIRFYDAGLGREAGSADARSGSVGGLSYSPGGRYLAAAGSDGALKIFDGRSNVLLQQVPGDGLNLSSVAWSPTGRLVAAGVGGTVRVYDASNGHIVRTLGGGGLPVNAVAWSRGGTWIAGAIGYQIRVWNAQSGQLEHTLSGHRLTVTALSFGIGSTLASGGYDATLRLWNVQSGDNIGNFALHTTQIRGVAFDTSGKRLASADQSGTVGVWRLP